MAHLSLHGEFDSGENMEFVPTFVRPLGVTELRTFRENSGAAVSIKLAALNPVINGQQQTGYATVTAKITFNEPPVIYALVRGGWLPLPFTMPPRFLVDRNVVISLRKIRLGNTVSSGQALEWWTRFFEQGSAMFNPLPYAFESGYRRKPTVEEFVAAFDEGAAELRESLPKCEVIQFKWPQYLAAYAQLDAFDERNERESEFLMRTSALISERVPKQKERKVLRKILSIADELGVHRGAPVALAVLSCLFEDIHGNLPSIGRLIIKPTKTFTAADAFNAISDLRHIELAAAGQVYFGEDAFALCTCDRAIALLWSALSLRGEASAGGSIEFTFDLTTDLFPRLIEQEILELREQLAA